MALLLLFNANICAQESSDIGSDCWERAATPATIVLFEKYCQARRSILKSTKMLLRRLHRHPALHSFPFRAFSSKSNPVLITPHELRNEKREQEILLDCNSLALYNHGHIPNSLNWRIVSYIKDPRDPVHVLGPDLFTSLANEIGLSDESEVVLYDTTSGISISRVFWMLQYYGVPAKILNGGWNAWVRNGFPISVDAKEAAPNQDFVAKPRKSLISDYTQVLEASENVIKKSAFPDLQIIDFRTPAEYAGVDTRGASRGGHVPGAINVPHAQLFEPDGQYKSPQAIQKLFDSAGIDVQRPTIAYCMSGVRSTAGIVGLLLAGSSLDKVSNYDGSMAEWLNNPDLPIDKA